jgi:hypothetical protein
VRGLNELTDLEREVVARLLVLVVLAVLACETGLVRPGWAWHTRRTRRSWGSSDEHD